MLNQHHLEQNDRVNPGMPVVCTIKAFCELINMSKIYRTVNFTQKMLLGNSISIFTISRESFSDFPFVNIYLFSRFSIPKKASLC